MNSPKKHSMQSSGSLAGQRGSAAEFTLLQHWSAAQLAAVAAAISDVCRSWTLAWDVKSEQMADTATCISIGESVDGSFFSGYPLHGVDSPGREARVWIVRSSHSPTENFFPERTLRRALFNEFGSTTSLSILQSNNSVMAAEIAAAAWLDFLSRIVTSLKIQIDPADVNRLNLERAIPAEDRKNWSGAAIASIPWCGEQITFYLNGACIEKIVPPKKPLQAAAPTTAAPITPLFQAIEHQLCTVKAELHSIEISLGDLQALALNDVVVLQHRLDQPALVKTTDEKEVCAAFLGKKNGNWALELVAESAPGVNNATSHSTNF